VRKARKAVIDDFVGISDATIRDETTNVQLLETEKLDVTTNTLHGSTTAHDENFVGSALFESFVLGALTARRLVLGNIRTCRDKVERDGTSNALHARMQGTSIVNLGTGPTHDPKAIHQGLGGERSELAEKFVRDFTSSGRTSGKRTKGFGAESAAAEEARGSRQHGSWKE
jgi:hypothetical protein